jgi:ATP-dependent Zn protease
VVGTRLRRATRFADQAGMDKEKKENRKIVNFLHFQFTRFASMGVTNGIGCASSIAVGTVAVQTARRSQAQERRFQQ